MWTLFKEYWMDPEFYRKRKFLQRVTLFQGISRHEFGHLFQCLVPRLYAPGEILFLEGDIGRALFILESGHVEVSRRGVDGEPIRVAVLKAGDYFGEMSLLDDRPRMATVAAMEPVRVFLLYKADLEKMVRQVPHIGSALMMHLAMLLAARLRALTDRSPLSLASTVKAGSVV